MHLFVKQNNNQTHLKRLINEQKKLMNDRLTILPQLFTKQLNKESRHKIKESNVLEKVQIRRRRQRR